ncbi:MAG: Fic family protein [Gammaproteobacteria bacterium]
MYFESINPFEDGNGRIGRALAEKALAQGLPYPLLLSLSKTIEANKKAYYDALKSAQCSNEITPWINYFVTTYPRQLKTLKRMLQEGPEGFVGGG